MYGDFILLESGAGAAAAKLSRMKLESGSSRNEAWLRDLIRDNPDLLPVRQIDPSFQQIATLCTELQTTAGPIDVALISPDGRPVLVETKLWRNPQARREVVAQILDYSRTLTRWSYSDLQREVNARTGGKGNTPFAIAQKLSPELDEAQFVDAVAGALRHGRFLLLIVGDGIHEDVQAIAELVNRNAASAFELALVEMALYQDPRGGVLVQPRITAKTETIQRVVALVTSSRGIEETAPPDGEELASFPTRKELSPKQEEYRKWWQPILDMKFDDPDQPPPKLYWPNNVRLALPLSGFWLTAYGISKGGRLRHGVSLVGPSGRLQKFWNTAGATPAELAAQIPGAAVFKTEDDASEYINAMRLDSEFPNDDACREWIAETLNAFVNVLRPRMKSPAS
jgi:hypothetical protein